MTDTLRTVENNRLVDGEKLDNAPDNINESLSGISQDLADHEADTSNPHSVTKAQVGLGDVPNGAQINVTEQVLAGNNITVVRNGKDVTINSTGGSGGGIGNNGSPGYFKTQSSTSLSFTLPFEYETDEHNISVYKNGQRLVVTDDYTETSSTEITLSSRLSTDVIEVLHPNKGLNYKGSYNGSTTYIKDDAVYYEGSSYICIEGTSGNIPTNGTYWDILVSKGDKGDSGTVSVGTTTTGAEGTNASVVNSGTSTDSILNFTIPRGDKGEQGIPGISGGAGADGAFAFDYQTATANKKIFNLTFSYSSGNNNLFVLRNGQQLIPELDYVETSDTVVTLDSSISLEDGERMVFIYMNKGEQGEQGDPGEGILSGLVDPTTQGVEGSFYLNVSSYEIFGPKTGGSWGGGTSIIGPGSSVVNNYSSFSPPELFSPDSGEVTSGTADFTLSKTNEIVFVWYNGKGLNVDEYSKSGSTLTVTPDNGFAGTDDEIVVFQQTHENTGGSATTGWGQYIDSTYTEGSPQTITSATTLGNNANTILDSQKPTDLSTFYNGTTKRLVGTNDGDAFSISLRFSAKSTSNNDTFAIGVDIGGSQGIIVQETHKFVKNANIEQHFDIDFTYFTGSTFVSNGGDIIITPGAGTLSIYDINYLITRTHKAR